MRLQVAYFAFSISPASILLHPLVRFDISRVTFVNRDKDAFGVI